MFSQTKAGTHSAFGEGSHTRAHTPKHGRFGWGCYHYPWSVLRGSETLRGQVSERQTLPLLRLDPVCSRRTQRACWAALLCLQFGDVAVFLLCAQYFLNVQSEGWYHYPRRALRAAETPDGRLSKRLIFRFLVSPIYICERPCRVLPISTLIQIDCCWISCGQTACPWLIQT